MAGIPVWKEGTQRYHDPESQKMVKTKVAEGQIAEEKTKGKATGTIAGFGAGSALGSVAGPIVASLRKEFGALNTHLAFRFEDIKKAILAPKVESREERLSGEDVVVPPEDTDTGGDNKRGFLGRLKDRFTGGIGTKTAILLLVGGLWAITTLGDKLIKPLSGFLKWLKEEALGDVKDLHKKVLGWWDTAWGHLETLFEFLLKTFNDIGDWYNEFDVDGIKGLSKDEKKEMFKDLRNKIIEGVGGYVAAVVGGMMLFHFGPAILGLVAHGIMNARILAAIKGTSAVAGAPVAGTPFFTKAVVSKLGIAAIVAGGIIAVYSAGKDAMAASLDEETGKLDFTEFASGFISGTGDKKGGWKNAITNALTGGPTGAGALIGVGLGAIGGPFGMLAGGLMGAAIGGLIGGIAGYIGADNMDLAITGVTDLLSNAIDDITTFFGGIFAGIDSWAQGDGYKKGHDAFVATKKGDKVQSREDELLSLEDKLENMKTQRAMGYMSGTLDPDSRDAWRINNSIKRLEAKVYSKQTFLAKDKDFIHDTEITGAVEDYQEADLELSHLRLEMEQNNYDPNAEPGLKQRSSPYDKWKKKVDKWEKQKASAITTLKKYGLDYSDDKLFDDATLNKIINPPTRSQIEKAEFAQRMADEGKVWMLNEDAPRNARGDNRYHWVDASTSSQNHIQTVVQNALGVDNLELSAALARGY